MRTRSFIILLILIPLLLLAGAAVYFLGPWGQKGTDGSNQIANKIQLLVSEAVVSPILSFDGEKIWYMTQGGRLFRIPLPQSLPPGEGKDSDGSPPSRGGDEGRVETEEYLLPEPVQNPVKIIWPQTGNDFIVERSAQPAAYYDSASQKFTDYSPQLKTPRFLVDPNKIIYDWQRADGGHELKISDKNGENFHKIADLRRPDYEIVASPSREEVVLFGRDNLEPSYLILVNLGTGEFRDIDGKNLYSGAKFSPDGTKLAVFRGEGEGLMVYDLDSFTLSPDGLPADEAGRGEGEGEFAWTADGQGLVFASKLGFFKYELAASQQSEIYKFKEGEDYKPRELILYPTKNLLIFLDGKTGYLYKLEY